MTTTTDVLGAPYTAETIDLSPDDEGARVATLVHLPADADVPAQRAVLHLHGFSDYFFQTEYAAWWTSRGYDFYALDLPKAGRSFREHQTPHFVTDLEEYFPALDQAWSKITAEHRQVVFAAHSTGGLTGPLWADARRPAELVGMFLNSPWFDLQGSALVRALGTPVLKQIGRWQPKRLIPRSVSGLYTSSLHREHGGEWDFDLSWKPVDSFDVYTGWLRAIRNGHARLHAGLAVAAPVLVMSSDASSVPSEMGEDVHSTDIVLDVAHMRRWATSVGTHVTYVAVAGARHDIVLSRPDVRARAYAELARWLGAYVE
ncbi:MAG: alpha/beta hydrolase [Nocardioides sp.]|uniref:alpha/beta hydrolase n=1 Tax=Nocardioides sp. TaxID=35761 RepID=UPI0039E65817